ncbi:MAG: HTH domain-containing protein, partial [Campylobacterales bacterium]
MGKVEEKSREIGEGFGEVELKKGHRLLRLAERLNRGEEICVGEIAREWGVSPRTVRRYLNEIEEFFGIKLNKVRRGCYIHPSPEILSKILLKERNDGKLLLQLVALLHPKLITDFFSISAEVVERFQKEWGTLRILHSPAEEISEQQWAYLQQFQKGLTRKVLIDIDYRRMEGGEEITFSRVHPLRILVAEGNWY